MEEEKAKVYSQDQQVNALKEKLEQYALVDTERLRTLKKSLDS